MLVSLGGEGLLSFLVDGAVNDSERGGGGLSCEDFDRREKEKRFSILGRQMALSNKFSWHSYPFEFSKLMSTIFDIYPFWDITKL